MYCSELRVRVLISPNIFELREVKDSVDVQFVGASPPHPNNVGYKLKVVPINRKHNNPSMRILLSLVVSNID
jgi:hypothetical protein